MKKVIQCILCLLLLTGMNTTAGWAVELRKNIQKSFSATRETLLEIDNSFGAVKIENWPVQEVSIQVEMKAGAMTERRAAEILSKMSVELGKSGNKVSGNTRLDNVNTRGGESFSINYTIRVPDNLVMNISNEFGDTYINAPCGASKFSSRFGALYMQNQTSPVEVDIQHGAAKLQSLASLTLDMQHSTLNADRLEVARMDFQHSTATMGNGGDWNVEAQHSTLNAGSLNRLDLDDEFSPFQIEKIAKRLYVSDLQHASVKVNAFSPDFEEVYVDAQHSNVTLTIPSESAFLIDASANFGGLNIDNHKVQVSYTYNNSDSEDDFTKTVKGYVIRNNATSKVYLRGQHSDLNIR